MRIKNSCRLGKLVGSRQTEVKIVQIRRTVPARMGLLLIAFLWLLGFAPQQGFAAPYAAMVLDARTGEVLHSRNADSRLHPASLTKMMTLYIAFEAVRNGEIMLDTPVRITKKAASEPPSKLGLRSGQTIAFRYLIRAAAVKSANDAATAIGITLSGSEAAFARRMTRTAKALGMSRTTFKNAHGLTESGHLSTARDMTTLGRHLLYDYPQYYNLFSRQSTHAGIKTVPNTNRRLLAAYKGADGIKTGYTRAAGFNLVASARRKDERIIATVFGGKSGASRNARVAELLDMGFRRAPSRAPIRKPARPAYVGNNGLGGSAQVAQKGAPKSSLRPVLRPVAAVQMAGVVAETAAKNGGRIQNGITAAIAAADIAAAENTTRPEARSNDVILASVEPAQQPEPEQEVVTRLSTSGGHLWGVNVGRFITRYEAEKVLLKTALSEMTTLEDTLRKVNQSTLGFDATFQGMTREQADLACRRLQARNVTCFMIGPS